MTLHATRGAARRILFSLSTTLALGLTACEPPTPPHPDPDPAPGLRHTPPLDPLDDPDVIADADPDDDPCACDEVEAAAVCGDDGVTYSSPCAAACAGVEVVDGGACEGVLDCQSDADCDPLEYCRRDGACGSFGACALRPDVCDVKGEPVCGCDGETYASACMAAVVGVSVAHPGACGCLCELIYDPVCGCDGETYANECLAACAGVDVEDGGTCSGKCMIDAECGAGEFCDHGAACDSGTSVGECVTQPMSCPADAGGEVCGCDGVTYGSAGEANAEGVSVADEGPCDLLDVDAPELAND